MGLDMYVIKRKKGQKVDEGAFDEVLYWRKANAIHKWFVDNVQDGTDDCRYYAVTKEQITELKNICQEVLDKVITVEGKVENGKSYKPETGWVTNYEDGLIITNPEVAEELLPTTSGFFFGSTNYDSWYLEDLKETVKKIEGLLETFDFENDYLVYTSSW